jgi:sulfur-carrier protein
VAVVRLRGPLKAMVGGQADHTVDASRVADALRELERAQPALKGWILDERGHVRRHIKLFVDGEDCTEDAAVGPDDRVDVLPAISGGEA